LLLDGQQRISTLYGIIRGNPPPFFDGNEKAFTGLYFNMETEEFRFYQPMVMKHDPMWVGVTDLMKEGLGVFLPRLDKLDNGNLGLIEYINRLNDVINVREKDLFAEEVSGQDKTVDVVVDIFNRVNSGGTKLSKGDLALAKICATWPEGRDHMKRVIEELRGGGYHFSLDWLLRNINGILTGEARFEHLHDVSSSEIQEGLTRAKNSIFKALNLIGTRLGLDHNRVLFGRYAIPIITRYLDQSGGGVMGAAERDRLLYWYFQSAIWGRFSGSTESTLDVDYEAIEEIEGGLERLIENLRLSHGHLRVEPGHFRGWSVGARFYPVLYALTRVGHAQSWCDGIPLKKHLLGKMNKLEVHHIFPKSRLYEHPYHYRKPDVNAVANYSFQTKECNLYLGARLPSEYFPIVEEKHPGALESQWIPKDPELWKRKNYLDFLEERQRLLSEAANRLLADLLHDPVSTDHTMSPSIEMQGPVSVARATPGGIVDPEEEMLIKELNEWLRTAGLPEGSVEHELADPDSGKPLAILDLAWPKGVQEGFSGPVAVLINEEATTIQIASGLGFRCFTDTDAFKRYAEVEVLGEEASERMRQRVGDYVGVVSP